MKFISLGGINEHGRNCFYIEGTRKILLDCGLSEKNEIPYLDKIDVSSLNYLFLSHSHLDHTGAIHELLNRGFKGKIISSKETIDCIHLEYSDILETRLLQKTNLDSSISYYARRSGHCFGSLSYEIEMDDERIIYTGDYLEDGVFQVDRIRDVKADFAIVDGCYENENGYLDNLRVFLTLLQSLKGKVILPLPKNGRNMDMIDLLNQNRLPYQIMGDRFFIENEEEYLKKTIRIQEEKDAEIILIVDPQLSNRQSRDIVDSYSDANIIFTGTIDENSYSDYLMKNRKNVYFSRVNVHETHGEANRLISMNQFFHSVIFHNKFTKEKEEFEF